MSQLNVRVPPDLRERLRASALERGRSQSDLVREALEHAIDMERDEHSLQDVGPPPCSAAPSSCRLTFVRWLADRAGLPTVLAHRFISEGRVQVPGAVCELLVSPGEPATDGITLDGDAV